MRKEERENMRYFGGQFPRTMFDEISLIAHRERRPKISVFIILIGEALAARKQNASNPQE